MFRLATLFALLNAVSGLKIDSAEGQALLRQSRGLEGGNAEASYEWLMDFSMVFQSCHTVTGYVNEAEDGNAVQYTNLVKYKLCPANKCRYGCKVYTLLSLMTPWKIL